MIVNAKKNDGFILEETSQIIVAQFDLSCL